jgi:HlyD family secretion protein
MAEARTQTRRWWLWAGSVLLLILVFLLAQNFLRERLPVRVAQVVRQSIQNTLSYNGRVEPISNFQFYSPLATTVKAVYVKEGDEVHPGKLMISLDDVQARAQVAAAESGVKTAEAMLYAATHNGTQAEQQAAASQIEQDRLASDQAQHNLNALKQLAASGAAAPGEVISAQEQLQSAQASLAAAEKSAKERYSPMDVARAQAALNEANASLAAAQHVEAQTTIISPISGTVYTLDATPSEFAEAGKLLLQMADLKKEQVRAFFDEPDVGRLALGQRVVIRWDAKPGREWHGHIAQLPASIVAYTTRNVGEVLIALEDSPDGLLPDTNVTVTVTISSENGALSMAREALHEQNGKYYVFKVERNSLRRVPVTIGPPNLTQVPILSGLAEGDVVATGTTNGQPLQENIPIKEER